MIRDTVDGLKTCAKCGVERPVDDFYTADYRDGRRSDCKVCVREAARRYRAENPERTKSAERTYKLANRELVRARNRAWYKANRERISEQRRAAREADLEGRREREREFRAANKERINEGQRARRKANPEQARIPSRKWHAANPERAKERWHKRRALRLGATVGAIDREALWDEQNGICALCDTGIDETIRWPDAGSRSLDHIVPLSKGGLHSQENVQWTHLGCNLSKGARVLDTEMVRHV